MVTCTLGLGLLEYRHGSPDRHLRAAPGSSLPLSSLAPFGPGIALYYAVLAFNPVLTGRIGEGLLLIIGAAVPVVTAAILWNRGLRPATRPGLEKQRA
jgi:hypothetical protein